MNILHSPTSLRDRWLRLACIAAVLAAAVSLSACGKPANPPEDSKSSIASTTNTTEDSSRVTTTTSSATTTGSGNLTTGTGQTAATSPVSFPASGWCNATTLHIRSETNTNNDPIGGLKKGDKVTVLGREGDWYKIAFKDGTAFVSALYIQFTEIAPNEGVPTTTVGG